LSSIVVFLTSSPLSRNLNTLSIIKKTTIGTLLVGY